MKTTCIECEFPFDSSQGDEDERTCYDCMYPEEEEFSVTVTASFGVMAENQEDANQYILQQFYDGNTSYTSDVETK